MSTLVRQLTAVGPHAGAHRTALRAGVSVLLPLLVLWSVDRLDWSIYAAFGAFTSLYGRTGTGVFRARMQAGAGGYLVLAVVAGATTGLLDARAWVAVPGAAVVAVVASLLSDRYRWHPPGALFPVFAYAACAAVPTDAATIPVAVLVAGGSAVLALLLGSAGHLVRRAPARAPRRTPAERVALHATRNGLGVAIAGLAATALGIGHPYWAMVGAAVPLSARDLTGQVVRGLHRLAGTALGLVLAAALFALDPSGLVLVLAVAALQVAAELFVGRNYALALVFVTPLALLMVHLAAPESARVLLADRGVETLLGVAAGLLVGALVRVRSRG